jgi:hypothetical protein
MVDEQSDCKGNSAEMRKGMKGNNIRMVKTRKKAATKVAKRRNCGRGQGESWECRKEI